MGFGVSGNSGPGTTDNSRIIDVQRPALKLNQYHDKYDGIIHERGKKLSH